MPGMSDKTSTDDPILKRFRAALDELYGERIEGAARPAADAQGHGARRPQRPPDGRGAHYRGRRAFQPGFVKAAPRPRSQYEEFRDRHRAEPFQWVSCRTSQSRNEPARALHNTRLSV